MCEWVSCVCQVSLNHTQMMQIPANSHSSPYIRTHTHSPSHILTHPHTPSLAHSHSLTPTRMQTCMQVVSYVARTFGHNIPSPHVFCAAIGWSFPPRWFRGVWCVHLCWRRRAFPAGVIRSHLVSFFDRKHFFPNLSHLQPPLLARVRPNFDS